MDACGRVWRDGRVWGLVLVAGCSVLAQAARAEAPAGDYLLAKPGGASVTAATGSPYVAIADVGIGITRHVTVGVIGGTTPREPGVGLRPRFAVPLTEQQRITVRVPALYYPKLGGGDPWVLARPTLALEHRFDMNLRVYGGGGFLWTACVGELLGHAHGAGNEGQDMQGLWWTTNAGAAMPVYEGVHVLLDVSTVMSRASLAGSDWTDFGGPPVLVILGAHLEL